MPKPRKVKKFNFRLQTLLELRRQEEDQKKRVVGSLLSEINQQQAQALELAGLIRAEGQKYKEQLESGKVDLEWTGHYFRYVNQVQRAIALRVEKVAQVQQQLAAARAELVQAARRTKILDKLRDKQWERYRHELNRLENQETDEVATREYIRGQRQSIQESAESGVRSQ